MVSANDAALLEGMIRLLTRSTEAACERLEWQAHMEQRLDSISSQLALVLHQSTVTSAPTPEIASDTPIPLSPLNPSHGTTSSGTPAISRKSVSWDRREIFSHIHMANHWGDHESVSGPGSTLAYTAKIREELPKLWSRLGSRIILDAPCGDYNWFSHISRGPDIHYIGGDIVDMLVKANQSAYGNSLTTFVRMDIVTDPLPDADFWLCRDCLFHLPESDIFSVLHRFVSSRISHLCTSHHPQCTLNTDIPPGEFRQLNLELPPYSLGVASAYIDDWIEGHPRRQLAIWRREDVAQALGHALT